MDTTNVLRSLFDVQGKLKEALAEVDELVRSLAMAGAGDGSIVAKQQTDTLESEGNNSASIGIKLSKLMEGTYRRTEPSLLTLPDGSAVEVKTWKDVMVKAVEWLITAGHLQEDAPPPLGRRRWSVVARSKEALSLSHRTPPTFISRDGGWWLDTWGQVDTKASRLIAVCQSAGVDPDGFGVVVKE